jgi:hypothetical protein
LSQQPNSKKEKEEEGGEGRGISARILNKNKKRSVINNKGFDFPKSSCNFGTLWHMLNLQASIGKLA